ncbi:MAG: hypothetical protein HY898_13495 [Deltaproteobacteria bacterium]|nr:hypothetical protein [Deltaproteobacteria bacterium]
MQVAGPNLVHGFHASAVHLGSLQSALARGIARLDRIQVKERWDEIFEWMQHLIRTWVQRCKMMRVKRRATGIRVELETQDDYGYYTYGFDVFPGRETRPSRARKHGVPKK